MADIPISYPIIVMAFVAATAVIGVLAVKFVKKSSKHYIVAGKSLSLFFVGTLMSISFIVLVAGNLAASGYILSVVLSIPLIYAMLISTAVVLIYTYFGGLYSCAYTDIFHIYLAVV